MFKQITYFVAIALTLSACSETVNQKETNDKTDGTNGAKVELTVENFDQVAGKYVNKEVVISGLVTKICPHGGKSMHLTGEDNSEMGIKTKGDRFANELTGSKVAVTGVVKELRVDEKYLKEQEKESMSEHLENGDDDAFNATADEIAADRAAILASEKDYISYYSFEYISHEEKK